MNNLSSGAVTFLFTDIEGSTKLSQYYPDQMPALLARLFPWADAMREEIGDHRPPVEQASVEKDLAVIHPKMDDIEFRHLSAEGRTMTVEQAIALALEN